MKPMLPLRSWRWIPKLLMGWATTLSQRSPGRGGADVSALRETPVRLWWFLKDADLYAFQFPE